MHMTWQRTLAVAALGAAMGWLSPVEVSAADRGVVWLTGVVDDKDSHTTFRLPLEWLAAVDAKGHTEIKIEDVQIRCTDLWKEYRDLPIGESREVDRGVDEGDSSRYVLHVASDAPARERALGKIHILSREKDGGTTDIQFPLDLPKLVERLVGVVAGFFGREAPEIKTGDVTITGPADLRRLADYGPFTALESVDLDSSRVRISIR